MEIKTCDVPRTKAGKNNTINFSLPLYAKFIWGCKFRFVFLYFAVTVELKVNVPY